MGTGLASHYYARPGVHVSRTVDGWGVCRCRVER